jgi:hypothetical protein
VVWRILVSTDLYDETAVTREPRRVDRIGERSRMQEILTNDQLRGHIHFWEMESSSVRT